MKKKTKVNKLLFAALALVAIVTVGFGSWYLFSQSGDSYPTLDDSGAGFQGKSVESRFGYLEFDDQDVGKSNLKNQGLLKKAKQGIGAYYSNESTTASEIIANVQPKKGLKVLFAYYSAEDKGFFTYPVGPFETIEITDPGSFVVPANHAFFISSSEEYEHNYNVLKDTTKPAQSFEIPLNYDEKGWVLVPLSSADDLDNPRIDLAFVMNSDGKFEKIQNLDNADLNGGYIAWLKVQEGQAPAVEVEEEAVVEEETETTTTSFIDIEKSRITAPPINKQTAFDKRTSIPATETATATGTPAYVESIQYITNNIVVDSPIFKNLTFQEAAQLDERYKSDLYTADNMKNDDLDAPYIVSAIEVVVAGDQGTVDLASLAFDAEGNKKRKWRVGGWTGWGDTIDNFCLGGTRNSIKLLSYSDATGLSQSVPVSVGEDMTFDAGEIDNKFNLSPGSYIIILEFQNLDYCTRPPADKFPLQAKTKFQVDITNISFSQSDGIKTYSGNPKDRISDINILNTDKVREIWLIDASPRD